MASPTSPTDTTITLPVSGMTCASCTVHVTRALQETPGVKDASVNLLLETARITFDPAPSAARRARRGGAGGGLPFGARQRRRPPTPPRPRTPRRPLSTATCG